MNRRAEELTRALRERRPQTAVRIVDAHAHAGPYSLFYIPRSSPEGMVAVMDRCGVRTALVSSNLAIQLDAASGNDATAAMIRRHPGRLLGYAVVNPWRDPVAELERWHGDHRFAGIKIHPDLHHYALDAPRYDPVWDYAEETGQPVLTHTWLGSEYDDLGHVARVAERRPGVRIIAGHAGVLREGIDRVIALAQDHPNVFLEICGSRGHGALLARMVDEVGAGRVIYGSDFPFIDMRTSLGRVIFAGLADADLTQVLGGTIAGLVPALAEQPGAAASA
ncbi:amidohydrolase family protein [Jiangella rhizosphaerae]|uniref:Amidohydrolase n=1 Tax=Jiangella rhizosphaerae TaxID=2293569 RepID=A0A418KM09_9ACTN|nr:amidohydrolase family protein [Jiangella rhizosphaerae]RIQ18993.1 amidohydrolase [Jiangella rhizosphaerae]